MANRKIYILLLSLSFILFLSISCQRTSKTTVTLDELTDNSENDDGNKLSTANDNSANITTNDWLMPILSEYLSDTTGSSNGSISISGKVTQTSNITATQQLDSHTLVPMSPKKREQISNSLSAKMKAQGSVRLLVTLTGKFVPEGELSNFSSITNQQSSIESAQESILSGLSSDSILSSYKFETIPVLFVEVDEAGLAQLVTSKRVSHIEEDELSSTTLAESTGVVGAPIAWANGYDGTGQAVAILDTGVENTHPFLSGRVVSEACYSTTDSTQGSVTLCPNGTNQQVGTGAAAPCSSGCSHGTHVAGIAAGAGPSFNGVAPDADIIGIQVFSDFGTDVLSYTSDQIKGLERVYALRNTYNIAAANMSLGGGRYFSNCDSNSRKPIIDNLRSVGIATVISSGNNGYTDSMGAPACISSAISVGSTRDGSGGATPTDSVSSFSNSVGFLSLLAPGQWINSSIVGGGYDNYQGTSMAAPHVAGAWAVYKDKFPTATVTGALGAFNSSGVAVTDTRNSVTKDRIQVNAAVGVSPPPVKTYVRLYNADSGAFVQQVEANASGNYTFSNVVPGNYHIHAYEDSNYSSNLQYTEYSGNYDNGLVSGVPTIIVATTSNITGINFNIGIPTEAESNTGVGTNNELLQQTVLYGNNAGSEDWFEFYIHDSASHSLETLGNCGSGSAVDTIIRLYNASGTQLAVNDDSSASTLCSKITYSFTPGKYLVEVEGYNGNTGDYVIGLQ